jgi:3-deoxy-manno-octulosonate cytidylyltransferase (CMP-KDO synthetase)
MALREERELTAIGIIPSRIGSVRLPRKPLHLINGISLIERVYKKAIESQWLKEIYIATDSEEIKEHAEGFGAKVIMTSPDLPTGTDRIYSAYQKIGKEYDVIFNIQGDEPLLDAKDLDNLFIRLANSLCHIGTLTKRIETVSDLDNDSIVKVVTKTDNEALYFSRSSIPFVRGNEKENWLKEQTFWKHIGIYAYRSEILEKFTQLPQTDLELSESLEQLRMLQNGYKILCVETNNEYVAIDTPEDVERVKSLL